MKPLPLLFALFLFISSLCAAFRLRSGCKESCLLAVNGDKKKGKEEGSKSHSLTLVTKVLKIHNANVTIEHALIVPSNQPPTAPATTQATQANQATQTTQPTQATQATPIAGVKVSEPPKN